MHAEACSCLALSKMAGRHDQRGTLRWMKRPSGLTAQRGLQCASGRRGARTDERGLTTLEWLLIVAAVAGLAALAVVLVQNVVGDTSEQIAGSSARETAAKIAATTIVEEANQDAGEQTD